MKHARPLQAIASVFPIMLAVINPSSAQTVSINQPKSLDAYQPGEQMKVDWEVVEGADLYIIKSTAQDNLGTYTYVGDVKCHGWGKHGCDVSSLTFDLGCNALPGTHRIQVSAHREKRLRNHSYRQIALGEQLFYLEADLVPRKPEILTYCTQSDEQICLDPVRFGYKDKNGSYINTSENRIVQWWSTLEEATADAMGKAQGPPLNTGLCYTPEEPLTRLTIYYINTRSIYGCGSSLPSIVAVVVFPMDRLPLNSDQETVTLRSDEYLPPDLQCTAPVSAHFLEVDQDELDKVLGQSRIVSQDLTWYHNNNGVLEEEAYMTWKKFTGKEVLSVCYSDVRYKDKELKTLNPNNYRDYTAINTIWLEISVEGRTRRFKCQLRGNVRIYVEETPALDCPQQEVCPDKTSYLNQGEVQIPGLKYEWEPQFGLSDYGIPAPKVLPLEMPLNQTVHYTLTRSMQGGGENAAVVKSCFYVTRVPGPCLSPQGDDPQVQISLSLDPVSLGSGPQVRLDAQVDEPIYYELRNQINNPVCSGNLIGPYLGLLPLDWNGQCGSYTLRAWTPSGFLDRLFIFNP